MLETVATQWTVPSSLHEIVTRFIDRSHALHGGSVAVGVDVLVGVTVGVLVGVLVGVSVGVLVRVLEGVLVGVFVGVLVAVEVGVLVGVDVGVLGASGTRAKSWFVV